MNAYDRVKSGKLKLKGHSNFNGKRKHKGSKSKCLKENQVSEDSFSKDLQAHGGWWSISKFLDIIGPIAIQLKGLTPTCPLPDNNLPLQPSICISYYISSTDDGFITIGPPRKFAEEPAPEEIFTAVKVSDTHVAFKTGYGKYLTADTGCGGLITAAADAIGPREQFEPVFQNGEVALLGFNNLFLSADSSKDQAICRAEKAESMEMLSIRCNRELSHDPLLDMPEEERSGVKKAEYNYVRKFQSWQDKKIRLTLEDSSILKGAKRDGSLHECMLDRREKMKSDRHCK